MGLIEVSYKGRGLYRLFMTERDDVTCVARARGREAVWYNRKAPSKVGEAAYRLARRGELANTHRHHVRRGRTKTVEVYRVPSEDVRTVIMLARLYSRLGERLSRALRGVDPGDLEEMRRRATLLALGALEGGR